MTSRLGLGAADRMLNTPMKSGFDIYKALYGRKDAVVDVHSPDIIFGVNLFQKAIHQASMYGWLLESQQRADDVQTSSKH